MEIGRLGPYGYDASGDQVNLTGNEPKNYLNATANEYDNKIIIPPIDQKKTKIYVEHVDENGHLINVSSSSQQLTDSNGSTSSLNNIGPRDGYPEYYEIGRNSELSVSYKGKYIQNNNNVYEHVRTYMGESTVNLKGAKNSLKNKGKFTSLVAKDNNQERYIVIRFVYRPVEDVTKEYDPEKAKDGTFTKLSLDGKINDGTKEITIKPKENGRICATGDTSEDKSVLYIPSSESVRLNIKSQRFFFKKLTQKPYLENGELKWKLIANVYVLNESSMETKNSERSGTRFFGNTNENVVNKTSPFKLTDSPNFTTNNMINKAKSYISDKLSGYIGSTTQKITNVTQLTFNTAGSETSNSDYLPIASTRYNGKRVVAGDTNYTLYQFEYVAKNTGVSSPSASTSRKFNTNSTSINVSTPLDVSNVKIKTDQTTIVNHSDKNDVAQIQKGSKFTIDPKDGNSYNYEGHNINTSKYAKGYQLVFDFGVNGKDPGFIFTIGKDEVFNGEVTGDINQTNNNFKIMGITQNEPAINGYTAVVNEKNSEEMSSTDVDSGTGSKTTITTATIKYNYKEYIDKGSIGTISVEPGACGANLYLNFTPGVDLKEGSYYRVVYKKETTNVGRIYGFRVTDCSDVNWKNVFRNSDASGNVNSITGTVYFSGKKVFDYISNSMINAEDSNGKTNIIPLAPYKHTNTSYIQAPKLGYRLSFDLKTSGYYDYRSAAANAQRKIQITPSYYFINKDGNGYTTDIKLYYKNSSGKYVDFSSSDYNISFIPQDGYRHTFDNKNTNYQFNTGIMSDKLLTITISKAFELTSGNGSTSKGMMAIDESSNYGSVQVWFGEFKLPNSTIAIPSGGNVNSPLNDGYIGVKFDIKCIDTKTGITLSYDQINKASNTKNSTQWDYDQYLGYTGVGKEFSGDIPVQLEKGVWHINSQDEWEKIKGTVILYDADNRAADDFQ